MVSPVTYRGNNAAIQMEGHTAGRKHSVLGMSDFSLTMDRGTVEQELVGEEGNYFLAGSLSIEGSLTACKLDADAATDLLIQCITGATCWLSGSVGPKSISFFFVSSMVTGFDISLGDGDTISEGSVDFIVLDPENIHLSQSRGNPNYLGSGTFVTDT